MWRETPPEAAAQQACCSSATTCGREPRNFALGTRLEEELLEIRSARQRPAARRRPARRRSAAPPGRAGSGARGLDHRPIAVEVRIERDAAPAELEADALGEEVVGVEVDLLEEEVLDDEEREQHRVEDHPRRGVAGERKRLVRGERQDVQREHAPRRSGRGSSSRRAEPRCGFSRRPR